LGVKVILQDIKKLETGALIVGFFEDVRPLKGLAGELDWLLCSSLSSLIITNKLRGALGELALLTSRGKVPASKIFMLGLGLRGSVSPETLQEAARSAAAAAVAAGLTSAALEYLATPELPTEAAVRALRQGLADGSRGHAIEILLLAPDAASYDKISRLITA
jgi:hypothetical protein